MPELPDVVVLAEAFHAALAGRRTVRAEAPNPIVVRGTPPELAALIGQRLEAVARRGKFLLFVLERDRIVANAMLTGRYELALPDARPAARPAFVLGLGDRPAAPPDQAAWTVGAAWIPPDAASVEIRYSDPTQMGKIYVLPQGAQRHVPGWEELGPDADDPALTLEFWRARIRRHSGELKNVLRNQVFVAGIGNAYSDEILHAARLSPFRRRSTLAGEEADALYDATRAVLDKASAILRDRVPPTFEVEVRDFLAVHRRGGEPCPRCGTRLSEVAPGGVVTTFCRSCQP